MKHITTTVRKQTVLDACAQLLFLIQFRMTDHRIVSIVGHIFPFYLTSLRLSRAGRWLKGERTCFWQRIQVGFLPSMWQFTTFCSISSGRLNALQLLWAPGMHVVYRYICEQTFIYSKINKSEEGRELGMMVYTFNSSTRETGRSLIRWRSAWSTLGVPCQPKLHSETLSQNKTKQDRFPQSSYLVAHLLGGSSLKVDNWDYHSGSEYFLHKQ